MFCYLDEIFNMDLPLHWQVENSAFITQQGKDFKVKFVKFAAIFFLSI